MSTETLRDLGPAVHTLSRLTEMFGHLPTSHVAITTAYQDIDFRPVVAITVHDDLAGFEAWREALGIDAAEVTMSPTPAVVLKGVTRWCGTWIELRGFGQPLATKPAGTGVAA